MWPRPYKFLVFERMIKRILVLILESPDKSVGAIVTAAVSIVIGLFFWNSQNPTIAVLSRSTALCLLLMTLAVVNMVIESNRSPEVFTMRFETAHSFIKSCGNADPEYQDLFSAVLSTSILFCIGLVPALLAGWLAYTLGLAGAIITLLAEAVVIYLCLRDQGNSVIGVLLLCGIPALGLIIKEYSALSLTAGFVTAVVWWNRFGSEYVRSYRMADHARSLASAIKATASLTDIIRRTIFGISQTVHFQGLVIALLLLAFFGGPSIMNALPPDLRVDPSRVIKFQSFLSEGAPYIVSIAYCTMSYALMVEHLVKPFSIRRDNTIGKVAINLMIAAILTILLGPLMFLPVLLILILLFIVGEKTIGTQFVLVLSFFVFPRWSATLYSAMFAMLLMTVPVKSISRWLDP